MTTTDRPTGDPFTDVTLGGRYRLDGLIGRGGMASVYRGRDLSLGRSVAVKIFAETAEGIHDVARRRSETALLASVEHHALVRLYDAARDEASGREYLVMEFVDGHDLGQALRLGPLSPSDAAALATDLAEALHVIHERGIVHRDVKPANVLLAPALLPTRTWNAKLADFGIARLIDDARLTRAGTVVGTPGYLSPEQVTGTAPGTAADVYSLGLVLLEARTGRTAYPGPAAESAPARLSHDPEIPEALGGEWVALLRAMTAREPAARPSALEVAMTASRLDGPARPLARPVAPPAASASASASVSADPAATEPLEASDAPTVVMPAGTGARTGTGTDDAVAARAVAAAMHSAPRPSRRWMRPAIAVILLAVIAVGAVLLVPPVVASLTDPPTAPAEPLPSLPGELGVHLEQLDEAVTP
ncbi:serine/threonine-protein kinase [Agromyces badenianii]|uniref:serine/threonine-protein kinase n=1 Tax=Agromyces badenianii TaxID=2080742 RepID=UPI000D59104F|nr:serine/threonine-protein kinase [Agromyces badenianii]PWC05486.1 serine/threonine protein kinase [Agromyces badenianii]